MEDEKSNEESKTDDQPVDEKEESEAVKEDGVDKEEKLEEDQEDIEDSTEKKSLIRPNKNRKWESKKSPHED